MGWQADDYFYLDIEDETDTSDLKTKYYMPKSNVFSRLLNGYQWEIGGSLQAGIYEQPVAKSEQEQYK